MRYIYVFLMGLSSCASFGKFFFLSASLDSGEFGRYTYINLLIQYAALFLSFGLLEGFSRHFPMLIGENLLNKAISFRNKCIGIQNLITICILLIVVVATAALVHLKALLSTNAIVIILGTTEALCLIYFWYFLREIRSYLQVFSYSALNSSRVFVDLLVCIVISRNSGVYSVLVGEICVLLAFILLIIFLKLDSFHPVIKLDQEVKNSIKEGIGITSGDILSATSFSGDQLMLGRSISAPNFALYSVHMLTARATLIATNIIYQYINPTLLRSLGSDKDIDKIVHRIDELFTKSCLIVFPVAFLAGFLADEIYAVFLKSYNVDLRIFIPICIGSVCAMLNYYQLGLLVTARLAERFAIQAISCTFVLGSSLVCIRLFQDDSLLFIFPWIFASARILELSTAFLLLKFSWSFSSNR